MPKEKLDEMPTAVGGMSFKVGLLIYVVAEAIAIGALVYHLLQR